MFELSVAIASKLLARKPQIQEVVKYKRNSPTKIIPIKLRKYQPKQGGLLELIMKEDKSNVLKLRTDKEDAKAIENEVEYLLVKIEKFESKLAAQAAEEESEEAEAGEDQRAEDESRELEGEEEDIGEDEIGEGEFLECEIGEEVSDECRELEVDDFDVENDMQVFISTCHMDDDRYQTSKAIYRTLITNGYKLWFDYKVFKQKKDLEELEERKMKAYKFQKIVKHIALSRVVLILFGENYEKDPYCIYQLSCAIAFQKIADKGEKKKIIPIKIGSAMPADSGLLSVITKQGIWVDIQEKQLEGKMLRELAKFEKKAEK